MDAAPVAVFVIVLVALAIGLSPVLLPARVRLSVRWCLALMLLAASLWFHQLMSTAPHPFHLILLVPFWFGWAVAVLVLPFHPRAKRKS